MLCMQEAPGRRQRHLHVQVGFIFSSCYLLHVFIILIHIASIHRGVKAFCQEECRMKEILLEGDPEEILTDSGDCRQYGIGDGHF
ncbi:hypothetical protein MLD38_006151 [Melastoma candidum]|uniref:Uncharacterized protein n=1 Tax=Melastoma candidum TaxID=119954 RepID=A0ACB9RNA1_9MYRT|nr:hypothetical protein MLD38_006151 [Melastoma candidum]